MLFNLQDIKATSRIVTFSFVNKELSLDVKTRNGDLFIGNKTYNIDVTRTIDFVSQTSYLGVVTRKTRSSVRVASGDILWIIPRELCNLNPGLDVWIIVKLC